VLCGLSANWEPAAASALMSAIDTFRSVRVRLTSAPPFHRYCDRLMKL
jgi:hypothetical protein